MRILFCSPCRVDPRLGAARMLLELAAALEVRGCEARVVGPEDFGGRDDYAPGLRAHLLAHGSDYDVVDVDYKYLSLRREEVPPDVLVVARAQLLLHHHVFSALPRPRTPRGALEWARFVRDRHRKRSWLPRLDAALREADLVAVLNRHARETLAARGVDPSRIRVFPNAVSREHRAPFEALRVDPPQTPRIAFIGMWGPRKGALDLPRIVQRVVKRVPEARFRLLGTRGAHDTADAVLAHFAPGLRRRIEVVPAYAPHVLPSLLAPCSVGVFPSYAEGFPLGVIEMLAAALPVVAYDAPGAPEMLPPRWLVRVGEADAVADRLVDLLSDPGRLASERVEARALSDRFSWSSVAEAVEAAYREARAQRRPTPVME